VDKPITVKVSSRNQIAVPSEAREQLNIRSGDRLLVDIQDGMILLIPQPKDYAAHLQGLYKEIWERIDTDAYLHEERESWNSSAER
jgi:AbrB family looped-hinge helix DNA binding protein